MFNSAGFLKAEFTQRTKEVSMASLAGFFAPDEQPIFIVRGLTGEELGRVREVSSKMRNIAEIIAGLVSDDAKANIDAIRESLGIGCDLPADIARRIEMLVICSITPKITLDVAVKLCKNFPIDFYAVTDIIKDLTGQGAMLGK